MAAPTVKATIPVGALQALRTPDFALLWVAQVISGFGDKVTLFALAFVSWELTRSALFTSFAIVIATVPYAVFGFFGGAIADAIGHRRAMIACDLIRLAVIGLVPIALVANAPLAVAYVLVFIAALCSAVFIPARVAIVPDLVPREHLGAGNALVYASDRTVEIVGAMIAGVLVAALGATAFYVDAGTFALSALLLLRMSRPDRPARSVSWGGLWRDAADGLRVIRRTSVLWANTVFSLAAQLAIPVMNGLTPVLIFREFGLGPEEFGIAEAALAVGAVVAGVAFPPLLKRYPKGRLVVLGFAAYGLIALGLSGARDFSIALLLFAGLGVANVFFFVPNVTISQEYTPPELRGRVFGARLALLHISWIPIVLVSGSAADVFGAPALIAVGGFLTLATAMIGALIPAIRDVP